MHPSSASPSHAMFAPSDQLPLDSSASVAADNWGETTSCETLSAVRTTPISPPLALQKTNGSDDLIYRDKKSFQYVWRSLVAGGVAGCVAKTAIAPLDRVKILFQTSNPQYSHHIGSFWGVFRAAREIKDQFGLRGLFQGHLATLIRIFPYAAIKFMAFEQYKNYLMPTREEETNLKHLLAGSMAGVTSVFFTYPLELVRVRMAFTTSHTTTILNTVSRIYHEPNPLLSKVSPSYKAASHHLKSAEHPTRIMPMLNVVGGLGNFYRGFFPTIYGMIPYAGVSFYTYEVFSQLLRTRFAHWAVAGADDPRRHKGGKPGKEPLKVWAQLAAGAVAGAVSQTASYPLEVIRRNMQVAGSPELVSAEQKSGKGMFKHKSTLETAKDLYRRRGWRAFFVGLSVGYIKVMPMVAFSFFTYERMKDLLRIE